MQPPDDNHDDSENGGHPKKNQHSIQHERFDLAFRDAPDYTFDAMDDPHALIWSNYPAVFKLLYRMTRCREDAEDLAMETMAKAIRANCYGPSWLLRVATRCFLDWKRKKNRRIAAVSFEIVEGIEEWREPADPGLTAIDRLCLSEAVDEAIQFVEEAPEDIRIALLQSVDKPGRWQTKIEHVTAGQRSRLHRYRKSREVQPC